MGRKKRWYLADDQEVEVLRAKRTSGKVRRLLASAGTSVLMTGPLIACNPKGNSMKPQGDFAQEYTCTTEQLEDADIVKCCVPGEDTSNADPALDSGDAETHTPECTEFGLSLGEGERCCPPDEESESEGTE